MKEPRIALVCGAAAGVLSTLGAGALAAGHLLAAALLFGLLLALWRFATCGRG